MSTKLTKSTTINQSPITSHQLKTTEVDSFDRTCANCRFSRPVSGLKDPAIICEHKADAEDICCVVDPAGACENFDDHGHTPAKIAAALAEGAKLLPLSQDKFAIVDAEDYEWLKKQKWSAGKSRRTYYATTRSNGKNVKMHRQITAAPRHLVCDHINHNGLDNRKANLRLCTTWQNSLNQRPRRGGTSRYKGVHYYKAGKLFRACITYNSKRIHLGQFKYEIDAAKAYDKKAKELFGKFAFLNFPDA